MKRKVKGKFWKGVVAMRAVVAMPIIIAMMVFPVSRLGRIQRSTRRSAR